MTDSKPGTSVDESNQWRWTCGCGKESKTNFATRRLAEVAAHAHDRKCGRYAEVTCKDPYHDAMDGLLREDIDLCLWCDKPATRFCDAHVALRFDYRRLLCDAPVCDECTTTLRTSEPGIEWDACPCCAEQTPELSRYRVRGRPADLEHDRRMLEHVIRYRRQRMITLAPPRETR